jgi:hypothetical protein
MSLKESADGRWAASLAFGSHNTATELGALMRRYPGLASALLLCAIASHADAQATKPGSYYVIVPVLEERTAPNGPVANRIYRGQRVDVTDVRAGWARVTGLEYDPRWVRAASLSAKRPAELPQTPIAASLQDSRIAPDAIPKVGQRGRTQRDVDIMRKGALYMLRTGKCSRIEYADKSGSRPGTYYVNCGGPQNVFFTERDLK